MMFRRFRARTWASLALVVLLLGVVVVAESQTVMRFPTVRFVIGDLLTADSTSTIRRLPDVAVGQVLTSGGVGVSPAWSATLPAGTASAEKTDGFVFLPALTYCRSDNALLIPTRIAANDWAYARTAAGAETYNVLCSLNLDLQRITAGKGVKITGFTVVYQITVQPLTTHTWGRVSTVTYVNNVANAISAELATPVVLATAVQANPYVQAVAIAAPAYLPAATSVQLQFEWQAVMQNGGVYRLYGLGVSFSRTDL